MILQSILKFFSKGLIFYKIENVSESVVSPSTSFTSHLDKNIEKIDFYHHVTKNYFLLNFNVNGISKTCRRRHHALRVYLNF